MRKFAGVLGILLSLVICFVGVMMAWLTPLTELLPGFVPADLGSYSAPMVEVPAEEMVQVKNVEFELPESTVGSFEMKTVDPFTDYVSTYSTSYDYLFSYSFGADFYSEIYNASYKMFGQLQEIAKALSTISHSEKSVYGITQTSVVQLNNLSEGVDVLVDQADLLYRGMQTMAQQQATAANATAAVNANLALLYQAQNAQTTQLNNMTAGLGQLIAMFTLLIRAIGVLIVCLGLMLLCKSFGMLGGFQAVAPKEPKATEPALETAAE